MPVTLHKANPTRHPGRQKVNLVQTLPAGSCASLWAVAVFAAINIAAWCIAGGEKPTSKDLWSGSGSIDLAINGFKALKSKPDVVLLGSSLMMFPFYAMDVETTKQPQDIFHHHGSAVLTKELAQSGMKSPTVYSLAIFGQMASDAFIYVDQFLQGNSKPAWLIYGIAPRDFSDHDLASPTATFTFKRLVGLSNFPRYAGLYLPGWQDRIEFLCQHTCYFYGKRRRLQQEISKATGALWKLVEPAAQEQHDTVAGFMLTGTARQRWTNSLKEYRRRYQQIGQKDLSVQMGFLNRLLAACQQRGIKVVLVNMPLTQANRDLLPPGFYRHFSAQIKALSDSHQAIFLDLGASDEFTASDYWDSTHLNHLGGHKLLKHLVPVLK